MTAPEPRDFWSRRRAAVRAEAVADAAEARARIIAEEAAELEHAQADKSDAEILAELGLADPDVMQTGDDFSVFLQRAVPARIRQRALRRLWRTNPVLANLDGLVDHGEDFTDPAVVVPGMRTAYEVGRGMMRHLEALAAAAEAETAPGSESATSEVAETEDAGPAAVAAAPEPDVAPADPDPETALDEPDPSPRRHMRFTFAET